jgi:hypothetical protein
VDGEGGALADHALDGYAPAVVLGDVADDGEAMGDYNRRML